MFFLEIFRAESSFDTLNHYTTYSYSPMFESAWEHTCNSAKSHNMYRIFSSLSLRTQMCQQYVTLSQSLVRFLVLENSCEKWLYFFSSRILFVFLVLVSKHMIDKKYSCFHHDSYIYLSVSAFQVKENKLWICERSPCIPSAWLYYAHWGVTMIMIVITMIIISWSWLFDHVIIIFKISRRAVDPSHQASQADWA